jgi:hypothetical protein
MSDYFASDENTPNSTATATTTTSTTPPEEGANLTLAAIETLTGISYVTLQRYAQAHGDRLAHEGEGRNKKYYPEAVEVFKQIREESRANRGRSTSQGQGQDTPKKSSNASQKGGAKKAAVKASPASSRRARGRRVQHAALATLPPAVPDDPATLAYKRAQVMTKLQLLAEILKPIEEEKVRLESELVALTPAAT